MNPFDRAVAEARAVVDQERVRHAELERKLSEAERSCREGWEVVDTLGEARGTDPHLKPAMRAACHAADRVVFEAHTRRLEGRDALKRSVDDLKALEEALEWAEKNRQAYEDWSKTWLEVGGYKFVTVEARDTHRWQHTCGYQSEPTSISLPPIQCGGCLAMLELPNPHHPDAKAVLGTAGGGKSAAAGRVIQETGHACTMVSSTKQLAEALGADLRPHKSVGTQPGKMLQLPDPGTKLVFDVGDVIHKAFEAARLHEIPSDLEIDRHTLTAALLFQVPYMWINAAWVSRNQIGERKIAPDCPFTAQGLLNFRRVAKVISLGKQSHLIAAALAGTHRLSCPVEEAQRLIDTYELLHNAIESILADHSYLKALRRAQQQIAEAHMPVDPIFRKALEDLAHPLYVTYPSEGAHKAVPLTPVQIVKAEPLYGRDGDQVKLHLSGPAAGLQRVRYANIDAGLFHKVPEASDFKVCEAADPKTPTGVTFVLWRRFVKETGVCDGASLEPFSRAASESRWGCVYAHEGETELSDSELLALLLERCTHLDKVFDDKMVDGPQSTFVYEEHEDVLDLSAPIPEPQSVEAFVRGREAALRPDSFLERAARELYDGMRGKAGSEGVPLTGVGTRPEDAKIQFSERRYLATAPEFVGKMPVLEQPRFPVAKTGSDLLEMAEKTLQDDAAFSELLRCESELWTTDLLVPSVKVRMPQGGEVTLRLVNQLLGSVELRSDDVAVYAWAPGSFLVLTTNWMRAQGAHPCYLLEAFPSRCSANMRPMRLCSNYSEHKMPQDKAVRSMWRRMLGCPSSSDSVSLVKAYQVAALMGKRTEFDDVFAPVPSTVGTQKSH